MATSAKYGMPDRIDECCTSLSRHHSRWKRNRDCVEGADAVRERGETYLPRLDGQDDEAYLDYQRHVPFFPATARAAANILGTLFRVAPEFDCPPALEAVFETFTQAGQSVEDVAELLALETVTTDFTGILVDYPDSAPVSVNARDAIGEGHRPFSAIYQAESFLRITPKVIRNRLQIAHVRVYDDEDTIRELLLDDAGIYRVILHHRLNGSWIAADPITPLRNGKPLDRIPFVLVATRARSFKPGKAPLDDTARANIDTYIISAQHARARIWSSNPIMVAQMIDPSTPINVSPGHVNYLPSLDADIRFVPYDAGGIQDIREAERIARENNAQVGLSSIMDSVSQVEAAETHNIRRSTEMAQIATLAHSISRGIQEAARLMAWWMGVDPELVTFSINTDFDPQPMAAEDINVLMSLVNGGFMSRETFHGRLQAGEIMPRSITFEQEQGRIDQDQIDHPPLAMVPPAPVEDEGEGE